MPIASEAQPAIHGGHPRILLVAYRFPPQGGAAAHRLSSLVRCWHESGASVAVLTGPNGGHKISDASLAEELPETLPRATAGDCSPAVVVQSLRRWLSQRTRFEVVDRALARLQAVVTEASTPDAHFLWFPAAVLRGLRLARAFTPDVILVSGPPWTPFLVASALSRLLRKPLVLDYRDPWTATYLNTRRPWLVRRTAPLMEKRVLKRSHAVVAAHAAVLRRLARSFPTVAPSSVQRAWIPNGYSREDFAADVAVPPGRFCLTYAGSLYAERSPNALFRALAELVEARTIPSCRFQLRLIGSVSGVRKLVPSQHELAEMITFEPQMPHRKSVRALQESTVNLVFERDNGANLHTPSKFYEAAYAQRPVLLLCPEGVTTRLARRVGGCWIAHPEDTAGIRDVLLNLYRLWNESRDLPVPDRGRLGFYDRSRQAVRYLDLLSRVCELGRSDRPAAIAPAARTGLGRRGTDVREADARGVPTV